MVHRREIDGETVVFGNQGDLFGNAMTWWDHSSGSVWSQPLGQAILGPRTGATLELLPSTLTTWAEWVDAHPGTLALDVPGWQTGFDLDDMAIVLDRGSEVVAYRIPAVRTAGVVNDTVAGFEVAVVIDPATPDRWTVFSRRLNDTIVELELRGEELVDVSSGTVFDAFLGMGQSGPLDDETLDKLPAFTSFMEDYDTFFPAGRKWPDTPAS